ncbi:MAG: Trm112 family protein [Hyphomicrobiales bacterium]|nr:Trm112 family protein [Hyphomicrobiales bacterium]
MNDIDPAWGNEETEAMRGRISPRLLEVLVCPLTHGLLRYDAAAQELISDAAKLVYPLRNGMAIMLVEEARPLEP